MTFQKITLEVHCRLTKKIFQFLEINLVPEEVSQETLLTPFVKTIWCFHLIQLM